MNVVIARLGILCVCLTLAFWVGGPSVNADSPDTPIAELSAADPGNSFSQQQIVDAFAASHDRYSSDELIVDERLRLAFIKALGIPAVVQSSDQSLADDQTAALLELLKLRKRGRLDVPTTRTRREDISAIADTAEIAIRTVLDRNDVSIDRVLCDPRLRDEVQAEAEKLVPGVSDRLIRKAVLRLRKVRRLRPELVLRVAQWEKEVVTMPVIGLNLDVIPHAPGVYLFRRDDGYLYIGEAVDLHDRMKQHFAGSHNSGLAKVLAVQSTDALDEDNPQKSSVVLELHVFAKDSPGRQTVMRRAYESELIRSREPKFNLRP
ncbi:GIY-YIG catalytic domain-containing protein [Neorhodopirellula lusitana]|uniref:GIY-YIG catalytic domain-containing protein n=1 Tax=Neorhodopirellula lusitana TaxID=445327 RepID=A0ABY1QAB7_9BACT|nr:GIY-YIG nuclease family protein [Neorhodopirellula lusitana]SMP65502.1 GIY-YIG catalytic domain-containing protein [Neorhodopirellula lusitana]